MKINTVKTLIGIVLVILAIATLLFWEVRGREMLLMEDVLVAERDIKAGEGFDISMFRIESVPIGTLVDSAVKPKETYSIAGKETAVSIIKGAQLSLRYLCDPDSLPKADTSCFVIRNEWIYMCSSSVRRGDEIQITSSDGRNLLGTYHVVYVKDSDGREVTDASSGMYSFTGTGGEGDRVNTSAPIHHIEIECELKDYRRILDFCAGKISAPLMLIRKTI
jgi:hypothetical protein